MYQIVDLATPKVLAISLRDLFSFFSAMMASFTRIDISLDFMLIIPVAQLQKCQFNATKALQILKLFH